MQQTFTIDPSRINNIRKRVLWRNGKILGIVFLFVLIPQLLQHDAAASRYYLQSLLISIPLLGLVVYVSVNRLMKSYRSLEIILNDEGVELKAEMMPYKKIEWVNLEVEEKSNGMINLFDTSIPAFTRKMNGKGWIQIHPEINNREQLLQVLCANQSK
jgi:hypothetical protein